MAKIIPDSSGVDSMVNGFRRIYGEDENNKTPIYLIVGSMMCVELSVQTHYRRDRSEDELDTELSQHGSPLATPAETHVKQTIQPL